MPKRLPSAHHCYRYLLAVGIIVVLGGCSENVQERYATYGDAARSGVVERGWLPAWLPTTSTDIAIAYSLDTNETRIAFTVPMSERDAFERSFKPTDLSAHKLSDYLLYDWWPDFLRGEINGKRLAAAGFVSYRSVDEKELGRWYWDSAANWNTGRVFAWLWMDLR